MCALTSQYFLSLDVDTKTSAEDIQEKQIYVQNLYPLLPLYKNDIVTSHMGYALFSELVSMDNEIQLLDFLSDVGLLAKYH